MTTFKTAETYYHKFLKKYQQKIKQQQLLLKRIKKCLPKLLASHILFCFIREDTLFLYTDSSIWASQLHFYQRVILKNVATQKTTFVHSMRIKIQLPPLSNRQILKPPLQRPSEKNIELLRACSESIKDKALKNALLKLSQTLSN
jgi:hypothetical protein